MTGVLEVWLVTFLVLWVCGTAISLTLDSLRDKRKLKYKRTLENIKRLDEWHEQNP